MLIIENFGSAAGEKKSGSFFLSKKFVRNLYGRHAKCMWAFLYDFFGHKKFYVRQATFRLVGRPVGTCRDLYDTTTRELVVRVWSPYPLLPDGAFLTGLLHYQFTCKNVAQKARAQKDESSPTMIPLALGGKTCILLRAA